LLLSVYQSNDLSIFDFEFGSWNFELGI